MKRKKHWRTFSPIKAAISAYSRILHIDKMYISHPETNKVRHLFLAFFFFFSWENSSLPSMVFPWVVLSYPKSDRKNLWGPRINQSGVTLKFKNLYRPEGVTVQSLGRQHKSPGQPGQPGRKESLAFRGWDEHSEGNTGWDLWPGNWVQHRAMRGAQCTWCSRHKAVQCFSSLEAKAALPCNEATQSKRQKPKRQRCVERKRVTVT